jgi:acyl-CoA thioester hydrolase
MTITHPNSNDFSKSILVHHHDIDELGHVNNVVYVRWIQEVATAHWDSLTSAEAKLKYQWVVLRHEVDYLSSAYSGDELVAITWVGESHGPRSERFVHIIHLKTNKLIVKAKTTWCLLDGVTRKPRRVDEDVIHLLMGYHSKR